MPTRPAPSQRNDPRAAPVTRPPFVGRGVASALGVLALFFVVLGSYHVIRDARDYDASTRCPRIDITAHCRSTGSAVIVDRKVIGNLGPASYNVRIRNTSDRNDLAWVQLSTRDGYDELADGGGVVWTSWSGRFVELRATQQPQRSYPAADNPGFRIRRTLPISLCFLLAVAGAVGLVLEHGRRSVYGAPLLAGGLVGVAAGYFVSGAHPGLVAIATVAGSVMGAVSPRPSLGSRLRARPAPSPPPPYDPAADLAGIDAAVQRLLDSVRPLSDRQVAGPSRLPGWTRGHVLTHIARNADGLVNLMTWARTGERTPQYGSGGRRNADIESGSRRRALTQVQDLEASAAAFDSAARSMPAAAWDAEVTWLSGTTRPARAVLGARLREIEIHHADLGIGYGTGDWPGVFASRTLAEIVEAYPPGALRGRLRATDTGFARTLGEGPTISGPVRDLLAWLIGRGDGSALQINPAGPLPAPPAKWESAPPGVRGDLDEE